MLPSRSADFTKLVCGIVLLLLGAHSLWAQSGAAGSEHGQSKEPPPGAPWRKDILETQREALEEQKPILFYFTKTF